MKRFGIRRAFGGGAVSGKDAINRHSERLAKETSNTNLIQLQGIKINSTETAQVSCRISKSDLHKKVAFTLAEVLITLGIIGVVAALTLPTVIKNYQKQVTVNKLKKAYSILGQVAQKSIADNGEIDLVSGEKVDATTVEKFFATYWLPYFNGVKVYPYEQPQKLNNGKNQYKYLNGDIEIYSIGTIYHNGRIFFTTVDGTSYAVSIMSWKAGENGDEAVYSTSQTVKVDINGIKPPNTYGKDVFNFEVDFEKGVVRPTCAGCFESTVNNICKVNGNYCSAKIIRDGWKINYL